MIRQGKLNAILTSAEIDKVCNVTPEASVLLQQIMKNLDLSARAYHRTLRIARTIADMAVAAEILPAHVAEASQLRRGLGNLAY